MTELETDDLLVGKEPAPAGQPPDGDEADAASAPLKVARIRCLDQVKAKGFTFAKGKVVEGVPLAHAEYLAAAAKAEVLEVS